MHVPATGAKRFSRMMQQRVQSHMVGSERQWRDTASVGTTARTKRRPWARPESASASVRYQSRETRLGAPLPMPAP